MSSKRTPASAAKTALNQRSGDRWAARIADLTWRQRVENLLRAAVHGSKDPQIFDDLPIQGPRGEEYVRQEAQELFGVKWKDGKIVGTASDDEAADRPKPPASAKTAPPRKTRPRRS